MEHFFTWICTYSDQAYWIFFCLLLLAGLNLPISEDIILITGGALANKCIPDQTYFLYGWIYLGCWISAWEVYGIGYYLGPKLYTFKWTKKFVTVEKVQKIKGYFNRFGIFVYIIGRFIPGGIRNAIFLTSGMCKLNFYWFIFRDGIASFISSATLFTLGYQFGKNYYLLIEFFNFYKYIVFVLLIIFVIAILIYNYYIKKVKN